MLVLGLVAVIVAVVVLAEAVVWWRARRESSGSGKCSCSRPATAIRSTLPCRIQAHRRLR